MHTECCVPWTHIRHLSQSGVVRLVESLDNFGAVMDGILLGIEMYADCTIVFQLKTSQVHFVKSYLLTENMTQIDI